MRGTGLRRRRSVAPIAISVLALGGCLAEPVPGETADDTPTAPCASYDPIDGRHYRLVETPVRWLDALTGCASEGGSLVVFDVDGERARINDHADRGIWTGVEDLDRDGIWNNIDGSRAYPKWGEATSQRGQCVAQHEDGMDYAEVCASPRPYVCECKS